MDLSSTDSVVGAHSAAVTTNSHTSDTRKSPAAILTRDLTPPLGDTSRLEELCDPDVASPRNMGNDRTLSGGTPTGGLNARASGEIRRSQRNGAQRDPTPGESPHRKRQRIHGDR